MSGEHVRNLWQALHDYDEDAVALLKSVEVISLLEAVTVLANRNTELHQLVYQKLGVALSNTHDEVFIDGLGFLAVGTADSVASMKKELALFKEKSNPQKTLN